MARHRRATDWFDTLLVQWCTERQVGGFQGRPNKAEDTCYSFWIGASLALLAEGEGEAEALSATLTDADALAAFSCSCQFKHGGIGKCVGNYPDVLHSYYALCGLSLASWPGLRTLEPRFGVTRRAAEAAGLVPGARREDSAVAGCEVCE